MKRLLIGAAFVLTLGLIVLLAVTSWQAFVGVSFIVTLALASLWQIVPPNDTFRFFELVGWKRGMSTLGFSIRLFLRKTPLGYALALLALLFAVPLVAMTTADPTQLAEVKSILEEQKKAWAGVSTKYDELKVEIKKLGDGSAETKAQLEKQIADFGKSVDEAKKIAEEAKAKLLETDKRIDVSEVELVKKLSAGFGGTSVKSIGEQFVNDKDYKRFIDGGAAKNDKAFMPLKSFHIKADEILTTGSGSAGPLLVPFRLPGIITQTRQQFRIRDLLNAVTITERSVEYVEELYFGTTSSNTKRGAAAMVAEGAAKPQAKLTFQKKSVTAKTIAHFIKLSRQIVRSAPALRGYVDASLIYGLKWKEDEQLLFGDNTGENLNGLATAAQAYTGYTPGDTKIDTLRRVITQVLLAEYPVTGFVLHPTDWQDIELLKDGNKRYIFADPQSIQTPRIWGGPVVDTPSMTVGSFLGGAFGLGATIFDVEGAHIDLGYVNDDFTKNLVTVLAEEDLMLVVTRPGAFVFDAFGVGS
ncbi:MAG TPA: phage major capsid protein [Bacteroidota bacterium]